MHEVIQQYLLYFTQKGKRNTTLKRDTYILKNLLEACPQLAQNEIIKYLLNLKLRGCKSTYINVYIDVLRNINKFHPVYIPDYFKKEHFSKATMSDEEIESFLALPCEVIKQRGRYGMITRTCDPKGFKIYTMFWKICAFSGMRMGEVAQLTVDRVDFGRGVFVLEITKTNQPRYVPIAPNIKQDLLEYIQSLTGPLLFATPRGGEDDGGVIGSVSWGYDFHRRLKRLGIKRKNLTPYSLRHSFITRLLEEDVNIFKVQKIVGHSQITTTAGYTHLTTKDIQQAVTKHPLIQRSTDTETILNSLVQKIEDFSLRNDKRFYFKMNRENGSLSIEIKAKY